MFVRAESYQKEHARKLCSATLNRQATQATLWAIALTLSAVPTWDLIPLLNSEHAQSGARFYGAFMTQNASFLNILSNVCTILLLWTGFQEHLKPAFKNSNSEQMLAVSEPDDDMYIVFCFVFFFWFVKVFSHLFSSGSSGVNFFWTYKP